MDVRSLAQTSCASRCSLSEVSELIGVFFEAHVPEKYIDLYCIIVLPLDSKTNRDRVRRSRMFQNGKSVSEAVQTTPKIQGFSGTPYYCEDEDFS